MVTVTTVWADERLYYPVHAVPYTPARHFAKGKSDSGTPQPGRPTLTTQLRTPDGVPLAAEAHRSSYEATSARIARRIELSRIPPAVVLPLIVGLLVLVVDTQALALITLQGSLATTYHLSASQAAWTLSATSIATCAAVPILTRLGDRFGLRRMFLVSLSFVTVGTLLCSVAGNFEVLVVGRTVLGFSASIALVISLIRDTSRNERELNRNSGVVTAGTGCGIALSFLFGGAILCLNGTVSDFFWIVTGLSALLLLLSWAFLLDTPVRARSKVDWAGGLLVSGALVSLMLAVSQATPGGGPPRRSCRCSASARCWPPPGSRGNCEPLRQWSTCGSSCAGPPGQPS